MEQSREGGFRGAVHERVAAVLAPQPRVAEIGARDQLDAEGRAVVTIPRVRIAALIALAAGMLFTPLALRGGGLGVVYAVHLAVGTSVLAASFTRVGRRRRDALALFLVLGHGVALHLNLAVSPSYPALAATALVCLLMGSAVLFAWSARRMLVLSATACVAFTAVGIWAVEDAGRVGLAGGVGALLVGSALAVASARLLAQLRASLVRRQTELAALSARLMVVQEEERRRLSRALNDELGEPLTAVNSYLWLIEQQPPADADALRARTGEARALVSRTLGAMRALAQALRPSVLDEFGLVPSLDGHLKRFAQRHGIETSFTARGLPDRLSPALETALYRIAQEALTNVARHAGATRVRVALSVRREELRLDIEDDGVGFASRQATRDRHGTGLIGIRERVRALGGTMTIHSGQGARLRVRIPLGPAAAPEG